jgi:hypothetical protein
MPKDEGMTKKDLLEYLDRINDDDEIYIAIQQSNKTYPIAYERIAFAGKIGDQLRLHTWLPDKMFTITRK